MLTTTFSTQLTALYEQRARFTPIPRKNSAFQQMATPAQKFVLMRHNAEHYFLRPSPGCSEMPALQGNFIFVVLVSEPGTVYCGKILDMLTHTVDMEPFYIDGHTSLSNNQAVLFAGEMHFVNAALTSWSNRSGHYLPPSHLRTNLLPHIRLLLPEYLYNRIDFSSQGSLSSGGALSSVSSWQSRGSSYSSFSSFEEPGI
ncbi:hypothetical protein [Mangrovibacter phragmitis]|uniref:hypothetical protein n=1 Tax=Mangrovibacter phragmitis TaxID=1691903 RepID=UPI0012E82DB7|nr:hypothetical protein [Mangrovibacter phragmitis]